ncbi:uncharacterized protein LOC106355200 [Brassica napus]|uniref:uncharacterized protein LOC106355200 n=1 Tax=Brassica napus TaxID=3708 RepID=UPI002078753D|nr:uncharacterized protein LOC106355200 [Brassica napus]
MGIFPRFGGWITQNIQQPLKASTKRPESSSVSETDRYIQGPWYFNPAASPKEKAEIMKIDHVRSMSVYPTDPKYYDLAELWRQVRLWRSENSKHPWYDAPAKVKEMLELRKKIILKRLCIFFVKMKTKKGLCHLNIDFTLGWPPQAVYEMFTNPRNLNFFHSMDTIATMVLKKDGPRQITEVEKVLRWKILGYNGAIPIHVIIDENHQKVTATYKKVKVKYMKVFEGSWKMEPLYVDQERLCKSRSQISEEEYKKCSGGKGRIGSKVTMEHIFNPLLFLMCHQFLGSSVVSPSKSPRLCSKILENM